MTKRAYDPELEAMMDPWCQLMAAELDAVVVSVGFPAELIRVAATRARGAR